MHATLLRLAFAACIAVFYGFAGAQQVTVERDSTLHAEPRPDAAVVTKLAKGATGNVIGKQGAWINLKTAAAAGWILSFNVRYPGGETSASGGPGVGRLVGGSKPQITATIGTRGLDAEDLKRASFDAQQLGLMDKYAATKEDGEEAARTAGLTQIKLDYLVK